MRANISAIFVFLQEINDQVSLTKSKQGLRWALRRNLLLAFYLRRFLEYWGWIGLGQKIPRMRGISSNARKAVHGFFLICMLSGLFDWIIFSAYLCYICQHNLRDKWRKKKLPNLCQIMINAPSSASCVVFSSLYSCSTSKFLESNDTDTHFKQYRRWNVLLFIPGCDYRIDTQKCCIKL